MQEKGRAKRRTFGLAVGIPAYGRCRELMELLESIYAQTVLPAEITIREDKSAEREEIRSIVDEWRERFAVEGCSVNYGENESNLGYDANLRSVIGMSRSHWVMLIGNDDLLCKECVEKIENYLRDCGQAKMISRSFVRFDTDISKPIGISRLSKTNKVFRAEGSSPKMIFRTSGFVGGLIVDREWASSIATDRYDGTLYYQIYLASVSFCQGGIGYIADPIVGGRGGNPPLFGSASSEKDVHVPGSYTPKGRARMWESVLQITHEVGQQYGIDLHTEMKAELEVRQSFHVFEMMAGCERDKLLELRDELRKLDLFSHPIPRVLFLLDWMLGIRARMFFSLVRRVMQ
jgi:abequosyltransferase